MIHTVDPRQDRLFDPFEGVISPAGRRIIGHGWQGVFRHVLLEAMPVDELARNFSRTLGAPTKELYAMAGLVFLADFFDWTAQEAVEAYIFRNDVQYALNLEPGVSVSTRSLERYQKLFRDSDLAAQVFGDVTTRLAEKLELDISQQRLDSTHVFSHMASFGRTKLMAVAIQRFLTQLKRHARDRYDALPEDFRRRYDVPLSQLFAGAKDPEARPRSRQQAAEDLHSLIQQFAPCPELTNRSTYQALTTIFQQQCQVVEDQVTVVAKPGGDRMQNPSDPEATYDAHKGPGYQVPLAETCSPTNAVQLITAALPQTACESDEAAVVPILDQLQGRGMLPAEMTADTIYGRDDNVQEAEKRGVELVAPVPGRTPTIDPEALSIDDFALDERDGSVSACPAGHTPLAVERDEEAGTTQVEMPATACAGCPFRTACPIHRGRDGRYTLDFTDKDARLAGRRREQATPVFAQRYARRAGIESTNSGLKNRLGMKRLRVRGRGSVSRVVLHKVAGWNVLRAAASKKLRAWVSAQVAQALKGSESGPIARLCAAVLRPKGGSPMVFREDHGRPHRFVARRAA
jgi:Transposase DDE domain